MGIRSVAVCSAVALVTTLSAAQVNAAEAPTADSAVVTDEVTLDDYQQLVDDLKEAGAYDAGQGLIAYDVEGQGTITLADPSAQPVKTGSKPGTLISGGGGFRSPYISFSRLDQSALIAGGGVALTGAICAIPVVGQIACVVAGSVVAAASVYVISAGRCSTSRPNLRVSVRPRIAVKGCYS